MTTALSHPALFQLTFSQPSRARPRRIRSAIIRMNSGWSPTVGARRIVTPAARGNRRRLDVQVVEHLDMIADEPDGHHDHRLPAEFRQDPADIGFEPRFARIAAAALIGEPPTFNPQFLRDQPARLHQLRGVSALRVHHGGNAVGGKNDLSAGALGGIKRSNVSPMRDAAARMNSGWSCQGSG